MQQGENVIIARLADTGMPLKRKAVRTRLAEISPFYKDFYEYLFTDGFLRTMSELTGIPDLIGDPTMYGGGTHENLHGQALDTHVDFNYLINGDAHRRMNLLVYLNKDWNPAWGGQIELHSNPRDSDRNEITSYNVYFNRAVLFETNERSWHGFPRVNLPPEQQQTNSRKCVSIYLYTKTRPPEEIAGSHGTFYVQRPLSPRFVPGYRLTEDDIRELKWNYRLRDAHIENYQIMEERFGRESSNLHAYINDILSYAKLPLVGSVKQLRRVAGQYWADGWCSKNWQIELRAFRPLTKVEVRGLIPDSFPDQPRNFDLEIGGARSTFQLGERGSFVLATSVDIPVDASFTFGIACDQSFNPAREGAGGDERDLAYHVSEIVVE